jgi:orotidine-5'-phosphate decarboxylase
MLEARWAVGAWQSFVCVGLDPDLTKIPEVARGPSAYRTILTFNRAIVDATRDQVCAFKPNAAFYEEHGSHGIDALRETVEYINAVAPEIPVILDAKRADIDNTNVGYIKMAFEYLKVDAITVSPYLGREALAPFLEQKDKGIIVLCKTSNKGSGEFQDLPIVVPEEEGRRRVPLPLYQYVALRVAREWNLNGNCGLVVGATFPDELRQVRELVGNMPLLLPGIGAQGAVVESTVRAGRDLRGKGIIVNLSRAVLYASSGPDFAEAARRETMRVRDEINSVGK